MIYNVDVALNGQQFTGKPLAFRYYDVELEDLEPHFSQTQGGAQINLWGRGVYDSQIKRVKFTCEEGGEREVTAEWDRKNKCYRFIIPPLSWLWGGEEVGAEKLERVQKYPVKVFLTLNNQEWIGGPDFRYHDHTVKRIAYAHNFMGPTEDPEQREVEWQAEAPIEEQGEELSEEELQKREEERQKQEDAETEESTTVSKRKGYRIFIHGTNFINSDFMLARFTWQDQIVKTAECIFKNSTHVGCEIPDMGAEVPEGDHMVKVELTLNGQQYNPEPVEFLYKSVDPNLTEEDLKKMDEEDSKGKKAAPGKKK